MSTTSVQVIEQSAPQLGERPTAWQRMEPWLALVVSLAGFACALWLIRGSLDYFYHDDDITHYRFALKGWLSPLHRWHIWGRPGYTIPTMVAAHFWGLTGCRVFSAIQMAIVAYLAYLIARRIGAGPSAFLAPALVWVQPLAMTLSLTTLTESPAALYMALTVWLYLRGNYVWSCASMSLLFVTRYETLALAPVVAIGVIYHALKANNWRIGPTLKTRWFWGAAAAMLWAPLVYIAVSKYYLMMGEMPKQFGALSLLGGDKEYTSQYGHGEWWHYLLIWPVAAGVGVLVLGAAGLTAVKRQGIIVCVLGLGLVGLHTVIYHYGMFESGGYPRFLVAGAVLYAAVAAVGLEALLNGRRLPAALAFAVTGGFLLALDVAVKMQGLWMLFPGKGDDELLTIFNLAQWAPQLAYVSFGLSAIFLVLAAVELLKGNAAPTGNKDTDKMSAGRTGPRPMPRASMAMCTLTSLAALAAIASIVLQGRLQIEPLSPYSDPHRFVVTEAVKFVKSKPEFAGLHAKGSHPMLDVIRPDNTEVTWSGPNDGMRLWKLSPPGTLYFWDNKYCGKSRDKDANGDCGELEKSLNALGKRVFCFPADYDSRPCTAPSEYPACVQVFIKLPPQERLTTATAPTE